MIRQILYILLILTLSTKICEANDTLYITSKDINTAFLREGTSKYLVYFKERKNSPRSQTQFWTRTVEKVNLNNKSMLKITQQWEFKDTLLHTASSVCEAATLKPVTHEFWWSMIPGANVNFETSQLLYNGVSLSDADTSRRKKAIWSAFKTVGNNYFLNWHLDLEVFSTLPYKRGVTFVIPFYDPGTTAPFEKVAYTVSGNATLRGYDNQQIDCWLLVHETPGNKEIFWISKKTREVLKLEQVINGTMYRYKILLGFSEE